MTDTNQHEVAESLFGPNQRLRRFDYRKIPSRFLEPHNAEPIEGRAFSACSAGPRSHRHHLAKDVPRDGMSDSERVKAAAYRLHAAHCAEMAQGAVGPRGKGYCSYDEFWLGCGSPSWSRRTANLNGPSRYWQRRRRNPIPMITTTKGLETAVTPARRFQPPWSVEEQAACFVFRDHNDKTEAEMGGVGWFCQGLCCERCLAQPP